jgi:polyhydroxyalkanoate synthesis regulator phasin
MRKSEFSGYHTDEFGNRTPNKKKDHDSSKTHSLKHEIDTLDSEIKHLQNKLKHMIGVNKK